MLQILSTLMMAFPMAQAHDVEATCTDLALDEAVHYCYKIYNRRSGSFAQCKMGAAYTYEAILMDGDTSSRQICQPYFMRQCDSGRSLMLAKQKELCSL